jgi:hypothetical protein
MSIHVKGPHTWPGQWAHLTRRGELPKSPCSPNTVRNKSVLTFATTESLDRCSQMCRREIWICVHGCNYKQIPLRLLRRLSKQRRPFCPGVTMDSKLSPSLNSHNGQFLRMVTDSKHQPLEADVVDTDTRSAACRQTVFERLPTCCRMESSLRSRM